jgi:RNA polymerase sigma factor (sigma-70 family)
MTRDNDLADDLLQATFARALESGHAAAGETVRGWLFRVAYNEVLQWRRRTGARQRGQEAVAMRAAPADARPPWAGVLEREQIARVRAAVETLPPEQRRVVEQRIYDEKTFARIAADAGLPLGTVLTRMRLALEKLSRALRDRD